MRYRHVLYLFILALTSCNAPVSETTFSSGTKTVDHTSAHLYAARDGHVLFVLWHDMRSDDPSAGSHGSGSSGRTGDLIEFEYEYRTDDGKRLAWSGRSPDGVGGTATVDGKDYDLAAGGLFVVEDGPDGAVVTQIDADFGDAKTINGILAHLERSVPEVRALLGRDGAEDREGERSP